MEKIYWLANSEPNKEYEITSWYRCTGGQKFVKELEKEHKIVGIIFEDNNIGFILDKKTKIKI